MRFKHTTIKDLAKYREDPDSVTWATAEGLFAHRRWISGIGKLTDEGLAVMRRWDALGDSKGRTGVQIELLRAAAALERCALGGQSAKKLQDHGLAKPEGGSLVATEKGRELLALLDL